MAKQVVAEGQVTAKSDSSTGKGVKCGVHALPPSLVTRAPPSPTPTHEVEEPHEIESGLTFKVPIRRAEDIRSSVQCPPPSTVSSVAPTLYATQLVAVEQDKP
jgi:hypothetical protein